MLKILTEISKRALLLNEYNFTDEQVKSVWLGVAPANAQEIEKAEQRLNVKFPKDYIDFLKVTNGFPEVLSTGVAFLPVAQIDYLSVLDDDLVEMYAELDGLETTAKILAESILIAGLQQEQYFLMHPPVAGGQWRYFKVATWMCDEWEFKDIKDYLKHELYVLREETKGLRKQKPKVVIDYSLRDHFFNADWEQVFDTAIRFLNEYNIAYYHGGYSDLLDMLLIVAYKLDKYYDLEQAIQALRAANQADITSKVVGSYNDEILYKYQLAARYHEKFIGDSRYSLPETEKIETLEVIEEYIKTHRKDLLKPKNLEAKIDYLLNTLFSNGSKDAFIILYEPTDPTERFFSQNIQAAVIYTSIKDFAKAKKAIEYYIKATFDYRPFEPFLNKTLFPLFDKLFLSQLRDMMK